MGIFSLFSRPKRSRRELTEQKSRGECQTREESGKHGPEADYLNYKSLYGERGEVDAIDSLHINRGYGFDPSQFKAKSQQLSEHNYRPQDLLMDRDREEQRESGPTPRLRRPFRD